MLSFGRRFCLPTLLALVTLAGCGGGGSDSGGGNEPTSANPVITLRWSDRSRVVIGPGSARSVEILIHRAGAQDFKLPVNRNDSAAGYSETITVPQTFAVGRMDVTYTFHAGANATGDVVGVAYAAATMTSKGEGLDVVTTEGAITTVDVASGQTVIVGQSKELSVQTRDTQGALVAVSPGSIFWSSDNPAIVGFGANGAQGLVRGTTTVRATVDGKASTPTTVRVTNLPAVTALGVGNAPVASFDCVISADGTTVFGRRETAGGDQPFTWKGQTSIVPVTTDPGFVDFTPRAMSADGTIVVGVSTNADGVRRATVWRSTGVYSTIGSLTSDAGEQSEATDVSADGSVIVGVSDSPIGPQAFRWTQAGGMVGLGDFSTPDDDMSFSRATGVSGDGSVVIGQARLGDSARRGFVWTAGTGLRQIGAVVTPDSESVEVTPTTIDQAGDEAFGFSDEVAWRWQSGGVSTILDAGRFIPLSTGGGAVFGTSNEAPGAMWTREAGVQNLANVIADLGLTNLLAGFTVSGVGGCSADGSKVLVLGSKFDGSRATFLLTLP